MSRTIRRSRRNTGSTLGLAWPSADAATLRHVQIGEMCVCILELDRDGSGSGRPAATDFGNRVFEALWQLDAGAMLSPAYRIPNRFAARFDKAGHFDLAF